MLTIPASKQALAGAALLVALAACESQDRLPRSTALPPPRLTGPSEPAPLPSDAAEDYVEQQTARRHAAPPGADSMAGFGPSQRVGADMTTAPIPADRIRQDR